MLGSSLVVEGPADKARTARKRLSGASQTSSHADKARTARKQKNQSSKDQWAQIPQPSYLALPGSVVNTLAQAGLVR